MKGSCIIDGTDIADLDMFILKGGDNDFLPFPERIEPIQNDWYEQDGIDADLTEVFFKERTITVNFYIRADTAYTFSANLDKFFNLISKPGYHNLYSREFDRTFSLRYLSCPSYTHRGGLYKTGTKSGEISVEFAMDDPLQILADNKTLTPIAKRDDPTYVAINDLDLSRFGIIVNQCYDTVLNLSAAKPPLVRNFARRSGLVAYPSTRTKLKNKQIVIDCTMLADNIGEFYQNYQALFNQLTKPEAITLSTLFEDFECYYSVMQNFQKLQPFSSRIKVQFSIVLTILKPNTPVAVLATEDGIPIVTEDGLYYILI